MFVQVFGGGPVLTGNPEPYAAFFDIILLGDGEELVGSFLDAMKSARGGAGGRSELLRSLSQVQLDKCDGSLFFTWSYFKRDVVVLPM